MDCSGFGDGGPLGGLAVVDCHCHFGACRDFDVSEWSAESILRTMDGVGIGSALVSSNLSLGADFVDGNQETLRLASALPERFKGYITINPNYPDEIAEELHRFEGSGAMVAFKIHPTFHEYGIDGDNYRPVFEWADRHRMIVLCHTWGLAQVAAMAKMAAEYPGAFCIFGHSGGILPAVNESIGVARRLENVYLDLSCSLQYEGLIELMCDKVGSDRVLFGTDAPYVDPRPSVGRVVYSRISDREKEDILGKNIVRLLSMRI